MRILLVLVLSGCTLGMPLTTAGVIGTHNSITDSESRWSYGVPLVVSTVIGIGLDALFLKLLAAQWSKPMS